MTLVVKYLSYTEPGYGEVEARLTAKAILGQAEPMGLFLLTERFLRGRSNASIADELGVTEKRASQLMETAILQVRQGIESATEEEEKAWRTRRAA